MRKILMFALASGSLMGCAALFVPKTSDPQKNIANAYFLIDNGRSLPARKLIGEALEQYQINNDDFGMATAYTAFGDLYRNGRTQGDLKLPDLDLAVENYQKAASLHEKLNKPKWAAINYWGAGFSFAMKNDLKSACTTLNKALGIYKNAPNANEATEPFETAKAFSMATIENDLKNSKCKKK